MENQSMEVFTDEMVQQCLNAITKKINNLTKLNIIVIGKSGVGKSTLINNVFRQRLAETGVGRPVTKNMKAYTKKDCPLTIYDTPGWELSKDQQNSVKTEIKDCIEKGFASRDISQYIHCIWYCINVGGNRTFDEQELKWIQELTEENIRVPVIIVLTQSCPESKANEMKREIEKENLNVARVVMVLAEDMDIDEKYTVKAYGLEKLIRVMEEVLPKELQETLQNVQKVSLERKRNLAQAAIATAVAAATAEAVVPIPVADAAMLVPTQITMIATITSIYGLDINKSILAGFVSATVGTSGATVLGKTIVANILKLFPGPGTLWGTVISAATASALTTALGEAYIVVMEKLYAGELKEEDLYSSKGKETIKNLFWDELRNSKK